MSSKLLNGTSSLKNTGLGAICAALAAFAFGVMPVTSVHAQSATQILINDQVSLLQPGKNTLTASSTNLAKAVAATIAANPTVSATDIAVESEEPYGAATVVRADRNVSSGLVAAAAIQELVVLSDTGYTADVAGIVDGLVQVNSAGGPKQALTIAGKSATIKDSLSAISQIAATKTSGTAVDAILAADTSIGTKLTSDLALEGLTVSNSNPDGLIAILQAALPGVNGIKGTSATVIPEAAAAFVAGLVSNGTIPDALPLTTFAVDIVKPIATNLNSAELVSNAIGAEFSDSASLESLASSLFPKYPKDVAKITQGLTADLAAVNGTESNRVHFINVITAASSKNATVIDEGATFLDPFFSSEFTQATFNALITDSPASVKNPNALAKSAATGIATGVGNIIGADGDELTDVTGVYAGLISQGTLLPASTSAYAKALITAANKSKVPVFAVTSLTPAGGGGGAFLVTTAAITANPEIQVDLTSIGDQLATAIVTADGANIALTKTTATTAASQIGTLAKTIATFVKADEIGGTFTAVAIASSIANAITQDAVSDTSLNSTVTIGHTSPTVESLIIAAIEADVKGLLSSSGKAALENAFTSGQPTFYTNATVYGAIAVQETAITNL